MSIPITAIALLVPTASAFKSSLPLCSIQTNQPQELKHVSISQYQASAIQPDRYLLSGRRNSDENEDSPLNILPLILTDISTFLLPGPPLPPFYIVTLIALGLALPGSNSVLIGGSFFFFFFFLTVGRYLIYGDDTLAVEEDNYDNDDTMIFSEALGVDLVALGGGIISSYLLIPEEILSRPDDSSSGDVAPQILIIFVLGFLVSFIVSLISSDKIISLSQKTDEKVNSLGDDNPSQRLMDLWDSKFFDEKKY